MRSLLERYAPGIAVLQDTSPEGTRRSRRIRHLNDAVAELVGCVGIETISFSRREIMVAFVQHGVINKQSLAETIARHIPAFA
ncbi:MAG: hypothetical protein ACLQNV_01650, partial [Steroidobacteraceae bacterium]